jgi:hypothetical protein
MNDSITQLRTKLKRRIDRVRNADEAVYHAAIVQLWNFLINDAIIVALLRSLRQRYHSVKDGVEKFIKKEAIRVSYSDEGAQAAFASYIIEYCVDMQKDDIESEIGSNHISYMRALQGNAMPPSIVGFTSSFIEPLYLWIDEGFDTAQVSEALLARYKEKCELFSREVLRNAYESNTLMGETVLKRHLWEYLHDKGIDLFVEPQSASGRVDMVSTQNSDDPLIVDAKVFTAGRLQSVASGFRQVYHYLCDLNRPYGYLVIYKTTANELHISLPQSTQLMQFINHNNKTIFAVIVDIAMHNATASKRGTIKRYELSESMIIETIKEDETESA